MYLTRLFLYIYVPGESKEIESHLFLYFFYDVGKVLTLPHHSRPVGRERNCTVHFIRFLLSFGFL